MFDVNDKNFCSNVKQVLKRCKVSQKEFAGLMGMNEAVLTNFLIEYPTNVRTQILEFIDELEKESLEKSANDNNFRRMVTKTLRQCGVGLNEFSERIGMSREEFLYVLKLYSSDMQERVIEMLHELEKIFVSKLHSDNFGVMVKAHLKLYGVTQENFANMLGISWASLSFLLSAYTNDKRGKVEEGLKKIEKEYVLAHDNTTSFELRIKQRLRFCDVDLKDFAKMLGISPNCLNNILRYDPSEMRVQIAESLEKLEIEFHKNGNDKLKPKRLVVLNAGRGRHRKGGTRP